MSTRSLTQGTPALILAVAVTLLSQTTFAEDVVVPVPLQAHLIARAAAYDRNLPARAGDDVLVLILVNAGKSDSERVATQMEAALGGVSEIAGRHHHEEQVPFKSPAAVAAACRTRHAAIVYLTPGFADEVSAIAAALQGVDVLTVAAVPGYVVKGAVLGFDVQSGRPKLLVHFAQARAQHVAFDPTFLRLAQVVGR